MSRSVRWQARALDELRRAARSDAQIAVRIGQAVVRLAETGHGDVRQLQGRSHEWRLRVGDWRVIFFYDEADNAIVVTRVLRRNERTYRR